MSAAARWPEEAPTSPVANVPSLLLVFAARVDRLVADAISMLHVQDVDGVARVLGQVRAICGETCR